MHLENELIVLKFGTTVCQQLKATKFILFTDTNGVFTDNLKTNPAAKHLKTLNINELNIGFSKILLTLGNSGMEAKLVAANKVKRIGINTISTNGVDLHPISNLKNIQKYTLLLNE